RLAGLRLPVEAVALAPRALQPLRVLEKPRATRIVFVLGVDVGQTHLDRRELVLPDPTVEQLVVPRVGVPDPARALGHERDRERDGEREIVAPYVEHDPAAAALEPVGAIVGGRETLECGAVGDVVAGPHERASLRSEDLDERLPVGRTNGPDERADGLV